MASLPSPPVARLRRTASLWWHLTITVHARNTPYIWRRRGRQVRWAVQRARRGWSDEDAWNLNSYLAAVISGACTHLADHGHSYPMGSSREEWVGVLNRIALPLAIYGRWEDGLDGDDSLDEYTARVVAGQTVTRRALQLLALHFEDLWD